MSKSAMPIESDMPHPIHEYECMAIWFLASDHICESFMLLLKCLLFLSRVFVSYVIPLS